MDERQDSFLSSHCPSHHQLVKWSPVDTGCRIAITHHAFSRSAKLRRWLNMAPYYLWRGFDVRGGAFGCVGVWVLCNMCHVAENQTKQNLQQKHCVVSVGIDVAVHTLAFTQFQQNDSQRNFKSLYKVIFLCVISLFKSRKLPAGSGCIFRIWKSSALHGEDLLVLVLIPLLDSFKMFLLHFKVDINPAAAVIKKYELIFE